MFAYGQVPQLLRMVSTSENPIVPLPSTSATQDDPLPPESLEDPKLIVKAASVCVPLDVAAMVLVPTGNATSSSSGSVMVGATAPPSSSASASESVLSSAALLSLPPASVPASPSSSPPQAAVIIVNASKAASSLASNVREERIVMVSPGLLSAQASRWL